MHYLGLTNVMNCNVYAWPGMYGCKPVIAILKTYLGGCFGLKMASEAITVVQVTSDIFISAARQHLTFLICLFHLVYVKVNDSVHTLYIVCNSAQFQFSLCEEW